jgi:hypothetical protein
MKYLAEGPGAQTRKFPARRFVPAATEVRKINVTPGADDRRKLLGR